MPARAHVLYSVRTNNLWHLLKESGWEWVAVILLAIGAGAVEFIPPFERVAFASDIGIAYPHKSQTVPSWLLAVLAVGVPVVIILFVSLAVKRSVFDAHMSLLGLCVSLAFTLLFTQVVKVTTGGLRPDFLARCKPILVEGDPLRMVDRCTGDPGDIKEGRKSFFSGHSSLAWAGLGFLAIYLSRHLNFRRKPLAPKYIITVVPIILAYLISISRVDDYWHRWPDVFVGAVVGAVVAIYSYRYHCAIFEDILPTAYPGAPETDRLATGITRHEPASTSRDTIGGTSAHTGKNANGDVVVPIQDGTGSNNRDANVAPSSQVPRNEETWVAMPREGYR